jgi:hypothetical protein
MVQIAPVVLVVQQPGFQDYLQTQVNRLGPDRGKLGVILPPRMVTLPAMVMSPLKIMDFTSKDCDFNGFYQQNGDLA